MLAAEQLKKIAQKELVQIGQDSTDEPMALMAAFPEPVMELEEADRQRQVRQGMDSVILLGTPPETTRGFVRAVLKVPLDHPQAQTFGVFVEVQRNAYEKLKKAFANNEEVEAPGTLAPTPQRMLTAVRCGCVNTAITVGWWLFGGTSTAQPGTSHRKNHLACDCPLPVVKLTVWTTIVRFPTRPPLPAPTFGTKPNPPTSTICIAKVCDRNVHAANLPPLGYFHHPRGSSGHHRFGFHFGLARGWDLFLP